MLPKYGNFDQMNAAFLASFQSLPHPFYTIVDPRNPYTIQRLLELTGASHGVAMDLLSNNGHIVNNHKPASLHSDPEDMIEEVTEDISDEASKLVMDLNDEEADRESTEHDRKSPLSAMGNESPMPSPQSCEEKFHVNVAEQPEKPASEELKCGQCNETFNHRTELAQHENVLCRMMRKQEVLMAQASDTHSLNSSYASNGGVPVHSGSEDDVERKVRVRTAISEEQQNILKDYYANNPRPSRDEFRAIAQRLLLDSRVVQVWFQNNRSRERKIKNISYLKQQQQQAQQKQQQNQPPQPNHNAYANMNGSAVSHLAPHPPAQKNSSPPIVHKVVDEQPLDLSIKRESSSNSTPASSPRYATAMLPSTDEVINLSRKSLPQYPFMLSNAALGLVPMERLMHMSPELTRGAMGVRSTDSLSPRSEKRSWKPIDDFGYGDDSQSMQTQQLNPQPPNKRPYVKQDPEGEGQFICDQCDKSFNKQSSLARHKYEHSGE